MKDRIYIVMESGVIKQTQFGSWMGKPSHIYNSPEVTIHVFGTFKQARKTRQQLDYAVCLIAQDNGYHSGLLKHE